MIINTNFASPVLATEEISKEYGYYELTIKRDNDEYVKQFDAYNYFLEKNITENRTKIELQTELEVDYTFIMLIIHLHEICTDKIKKCFLING